MFYWLTALYKKAFEPKKPTSPKKYSCFSLNCQATFDSIKEKDEHETKHL